MRPIRILELRSVRGTGGGPEKTILLGAASADRRRFAVTVCYIRDTRDNVFAIDRRARELDVDYVEVRERHSFDPSIVRRLRSVVRRRHIDIVHSHDHKTDALALLLARAERVTPVATAHGWTGHSRRERWLYYPLDKRLLSLFDRVVAVSSDIQRTLVRAGADPARVVTLPNGIDPVAFRRRPADRARVRTELQMAPDALVVGAVGRLEPQKRFDVLIDAFERLRRRRPNLRIVIAGEGGVRAALEQQIDRLDLRRHITLLGHRTDIASLHSAMDVFVQSSDYEGTPNAVLEAMALETPVVATTAGGTASLIDDEVHGLLVRPRDSAALADAIERALADAPATRRRVTAARARVEGKLSFEARMRVLETMYEDLAR
jgi:glycosyltransferase involved in cell wall biosynthesis